MIAWAHEKHSFETYWVHLDVHLLKPRWFLNYARIRPSLRINSPQKKQTKTSILHLDIKFLILIIWANKTPRTFKYRCINTEMMFWLVCLSMMSDLPKIKNRTETPFWDTDALQMYISKNRWFSIAWVSTHLEDTFAWEMSKNLIWRHRGHLGVHLSKEEMSFESLSKYNLTKSSFLKKFRNIYKTIFD